MDDNEVTDRTEENLVDSLTIADSEDWAVLLLRTDQNQGGEPSADRSNGEKVDFTLPAEQNNRPKRFKRFKLHATNKKSKIQITVGNSSVSKGNILVKVGGAKSEKLTAGEFMEANVGRKTKVKITLARGVASAQVELVATAVMP